MNKRNYLVIFFVIFCNSLLGQTANDYSVVRLNDIVGDTIEYSEIERFNLYREIINTKCEFAIYIMESDKLKLRVFRNDTSFVDYKYEPESFLKDKEKVQTSHEIFSERKTLIEPSKPLEYRNLTLGYRNNGVVFGNSKKCNGIRFNIWDPLVKVQNNGINVAFRASSEISNGIEIGLLTATDSISNGLQFALWSVYTYKANGIIIGGIGSGAEIMNGIALGGVAVGTDDGKFNGIGISGLGAVGDSLNGLFIGALGASNWSDKSQSVNGVALGVLTGARAVKLNGFSASIIGNRTDTLNGVNFTLGSNLATQVNGVQIALGYNDAIDLNGLQLSIYNYAEKASGFQIGIINHMESKKYLKILPFINFQIRREKNKRKKNGY